MTIMMVMALIDNGGDDDVDKRFEKGILCGSNCSIEVEQKKCKVLRVLL